MVSAGTFYFVLAIGTGSCAVFGYLLWLRTRSSLFPLASFFLYYWSLHGAWTLVSDRLGRKDAGLRYSYIEDKLFNISLDGYYLQTLVLYSLFIFAVQVTMLLLVPKVGRESSGDLPPPTMVSHRALLLAGVGFGLASLLVVRDGLAEAASSGLSPYVFLREGYFGEDRAGFTLHQLLNNFSITSLSLGLAVFLSGPKAKILSGPRENWCLPVYLLLNAGAVGFNFALGYKNGVIFLGIAAAFLYLGNAPRPNRRALLMLAVSGVAVMGLIDVFRSVPLPLLGKTIVEFDAAQLAEVAEAVGGSNERFGAHFSMYGALRYNVPPTGGSSISALFLSVVPRAIWPDRPVDIYEYYAKSVRATEGQGYSIHHSTAWYLNFGEIGVFIGGIVLGAIGALLFRASTGAGREARPYPRIFKALCALSFFAYMPSLVRGSIETYKGATIDSILIPVLVLGIAHFWHSHPILAPKRTGSEPLSSLETP